MMSRTTHEADLKALLTLPPGNKTVIDPNTGAESTAPLTNEEREPSAQSLQALSLIIDHAVANMEVKGVKVDIGTPLVAVIAAGAAPSFLDGGVAFGVVLSDPIPGAPIEPAAATQSNDGTGHVA